MPAKRRRTSRDARRRSLGQNFLADRTEIDRIIQRIDPQRDELIVDVGAGRGSLTIPLAQAGTRVIAVEKDSAWVSRLHEKAKQAGLLDRIEIVRCDFRAIRWPVDPYRVVANPPFGLTTALFEKLFDTPAEGPRRADVLIQLDVARKRSVVPPASLRSAAWAPWWTFELGPTVPRTAFRPVPRVDAAVLTARRRDPAVLPEWLSPRLRELLRPGWEPPKRQQGIEGLKWPNY